MREEEFFKIMHDQLKVKFPSFCGCGIIHIDELDYNTRTIEVQGHADYTNMGFGRIFHRNCPAPCMSTQTRSIEFDPETEDKFFDYIGNRKRREHKRAAETVEDFRQEYNTWLRNLGHEDKVIVLGIGYRTLDEIFLPLAKSRIFYLNGRDIPSIKADDINRGLRVLSKNPGRIELVAIQADREYMEGHKKVIQTIREQDADLRRHTTILAIGDYKDLEAGYRQLDLNGLIPAQDRDIARKIIGAYLPLSTD
jgi:hypothetical protein